MITLFERIIATISDIFAFGASLVAVYLFLFQREKISSAFNLLMNYSKQLTLTDLKSKFERLNDYNANDEKQKDEVINILHEIEGQLNGNRKLKEDFKDVLRKVTTFTTAKKEITEPIKRMLVSELRENLRTINLENYTSINSKKK